MFLLKKDFMYIKLNITSLQYFFTKTIRTKICSIYFSFFHRITLYFFIHSETSIPT